MVIAVLLLVVAPLIELYVIIQVAHVIGTWETIALLVVESLIGAWLLKRQGGNVLDKITAAVNEGRVPSKELVDGLLIIVAGALMLAPGFIGDVIGFALLIPATRSLARRPLMKRFAAGRAPGWVTMGSAGGARFVGTFRANDVYEASARDSSSSSSGSQQLPHLDP